MIEEQEVRRRRRRRGAGEIQQIVSEFKNGELTQEEFCQRQGLTVSTLGRYLRQGRTSNEANNRGLAVELAVKKGGAEGCWRLWSQRERGQWATDCSGSRL
jgi:transcriptional regulator with XRE-family HTH domain